MFYSTFFWTLKKPLVCISAKKIFFTVPLKKYRKVTYILDGYMLMDFGPIKSNYGCNQGLICAITSRIRMRCNSFWWIPLLTRQWKMFCCIACIYFMKKYYIMSVLAAHLHLKNVSAQKTWRERLLSQVRMHGSILLHMFSFSTVYIQEPVLKRILATVLCVFGRLSSTKHEK